MKPISKKGELKNSAPCEAGSTKESAEDVAAVIELMNKGIPKRTARAMAFTDKGKKQPK